MDKIIVEKIKFLKKCIIELNDFLKIDKQKFCSSSNNKAAAKTYMYEAIQTAIFLSVHTLKKYKLEDCENYYKVIEVLCRNGKLSPENINLYMQILDIRNKILFDFEKLNSEELYDIIEKNVYTFTIFLKDLKNAILP